MSEEDEPVLRDENGDPADEKFEWAVRSKILGNPVRGLRSSTGDQIEGKPCVSVILTLENGVDLVITAKEATELNIIIRAPAEQDSASKMVN